MNIYENQLSYISNLYNDLIHKNGYIEKEKYDLEYIIFKQEDQFTKIINKIEEHNLILNEKIDKYKIIKNGKYTKYKNYINNNLFNSFDSEYEKNEKYKSNFPLIKINYINKEISKNESILNRII